MTSLTHMATVYDRGPETAHRRVCERPLSECDVCLSWWEEFLQAVRDGRVVVESDTEQTELPV